MFSNINLHKQIENEIHLFVQSVKKQINLNILTIGTAGAGKTKFFFQNGKISKFVIGHEEHRISNDDYYNKGFKRPFYGPASAEIDKFSSFMTTSRHFAVEFPCSYQFYFFLFYKKLNFNLIYLYKKIKETSTQPNSELIPKMFDMKTGSGGTGKGIKMKFSLPDNYDPTKGICYIKDRDFIVKTEDKSQKYDAYIKFYYYKRSSLPENTDFDQLKCYSEKNIIVLSAPIRTDYKGQFRSVPMENCKKNIKIINIITFRQL
jgi:hypothetical protein